MLRAETAEEDQTRTDPRECRRGWLCWIVPPYIPNAPALVAEGVDFSRLFLVYARDDREASWAMNQAMRSRACKLVLACAERARAQ